ncbi:hypothetical protein RchiOBHm_Chr1g0320881 [Rosa chinensis]|uniref:Uncharacterized protein n=2 Tax=Rosa chinensis TaxID=74649 RepID=A0A2P6S8T8_ROSCH|nr:hypothetical protein RchiOBHm_Chr1g0320881 [Rosa chinensis]
MIAAANWSKAGGDAAQVKKAFDPELVPLQRVMILEFRENVAAWVCFHDRKDAFKGFLGRVLRLKSRC